jgi:hypothetical protein
MIKLMVVIIFLLFVSASALCQIKISTITNENNPSSKDVMRDLRSKMSSHSKEFTLVGNNDSSIGIVIAADCIPRTQKNEPFVCFYTSHYTGGTSKTFMGGGIFSGASSFAVADNLLASIAQDILERWNEMIRANAIESLEACLFLTQSSCKVPDTLVPELKSKVINLSQYIQKGSLKK